MKSVLISINPKLCELIASGKKTIEVRKSKPNALSEFGLKRPPNSWCYVEDET